MLNDDDPPTENLVFTGAGARVKRRGGQPVPNEDYCGMMMNLSTAPQLFEGRNAGRVDVYPQAFLGNLGHYQCTTLPDMFDQVIREINSVIAENEAVQHHALGPLLGGSCQVYNSAIHRMWYDVASHDVQHAEQTAATAAVFAKSASDKSTANRLLTRLQQRGRPFRRLESKLSTPSINS